MPVSCVSDLLLMCHLVRVMQITGTRYPLALLRCMGMLQTNWIAVDDWEVPFHYEEDHLAGRTHEYQHHRVLGVQRNGPGLSSVGIADNVISDC